MRTCLVSIPALGLLFVLACSSDGEDAAIPAPGTTAAPDAGSADAEQPLIPPPTQDAGITPVVPLGPTTTKTFQQGVDGYAGTKSVGISTYGGLGIVGAYNANGTTFADGQNDWCTGVDIPSGAYSEVWLLRFDDLGLPANAQVVLATLAVHAFGNDSSANLFLQGSYLAASWFGDTPLACAGCQSPVGWRYRNDTGAPWGALGAAGQGTDILASKSFRAPDTGFLALGYTPNEYTAALDPAVVQKWTTSATNFGVRIVAGVSNVHMTYVQAQRDPGGRPLAMRPKLSITFAVPQ